jgi:hypothetical protein
VRTVVVIGDGAEWIWHSARAFRGLPGIELVEIIDLYHAYEYLWAVGNAVFGAETAAAAAWVEPLKTRLYEEGAAPLHAALVALARTLARAAPAGAEERHHHLHAACDQQRAPEHRRVQPRHAPATHLSPHRRVVWPGAGTIRRPLSRRPVV